MVEAQKISSLAAHSATVSSIKIGQRSSRVFLTGSHDRLVKVWTVGSRNCSQTLSGHISQVEAVGLDFLEVLAVAGSSGGSIKIWDIETAQGTECLIELYVPLEDIEQQSPV
jgi:katanin p80 WD40 repeat-containing subunit B1